MKRYRFQLTPPGAPGRNVVRTSIAAGRLLLIALFCAGAAQAQSICDAIYSFDGNLADSSGNGYDGSAFGREGQPATPTFGEGISGQALLFDGATGISTSLDLHFDNCPQVTITGWLRLNTQEPSGASYIMSAGAYGPHGASLFGRTMVLRGRGNGLQIKDAMRDERAWFFFAGIYDFDAGTFKLRFRNRTVEANLAERRREPEGETFFGVRDARLTSPATDIYLDEVRIVSRALSDEEIGRIVAQVTSRPWLTAIAHNAPRSGQPSSGPVNAGLSGPIEAGGAGSDLSMSQSGQVPTYSGPATAEDYAAANEEGQTLDSMRESMAAQDPLAGASEAVAERGSQNRPLDLESDGSGSESGSGGYASTTTIPHPVGSKQYSGVSGSRGDIIREVDFFNPAMTSQGTFNAAWLTGIRVSERMDRPCRVDITGLRPIEYGRSRTHELWYENLRAGDCDTTSDLQVSVRMSQSSPAPAAGGDASVIGQVQVCHNDRDNRRVKGLRINGSRIRSDGTLVVEGNADAAERPNCRTWAPAVICPANTMATGLVVHSSEASGDNEQIVGLQLICREVSIQL